MISERNDLFMQAGIKKRILNHFQCKKQFSLTIFEVKSQLCLKKNLIPVKTVFVDCLISWFRPETFPLVLNAAQLWIPNLIFSFWITVGLLSDIQKLDKWNTLIESDIKELEWIDSSSDTEEEGGSEGESDDDMDID